MDRQPEPRQVNCPIVVNLDAYESLSDSEREALDGSVDEAIDHYLANYGELLKRWDTVLEEKGVEKVTISPEVIEEFRVTAGEPIQKKWIEDMEAQGIPGQELYDLMVKTLADAKSGS